METQNQTPQRRTFVGSNIWIGIILFVAGLGLLGYKMGLPLPSWLLDRKSVV